LLNILSFQRHIDDALAVAGNNQVVKDKIINWQNCGDKWAHYSRNTVPRNRFIRTSNYAEQNHWSIAANAPDDPNRTLEQNIVDIMERDKTLADKRQGALYQWKAVENEHLNAMPPERADDLTLARKKLVEKAYKFFLLEYEHSKQYDVTDAEVDGVKGSYVRHINQQGPGRFLPDVDLCNSCNESIAMTMCRHDIAKRKHRGMPIFDPALIDPVHLSRTILPRARRDGSYVASAPRMPGDETNTDTSDLFGSDATNNNDADMFGSNDAEINDATDLEGAVEQPSSSTPNQVHGVLVSPSKQLMPSIPLNADGTSTRELKRSVPHRTLLVKAQEIATLVGPLETLTQHAVLNHLTDLLAFLRAGDFSNGRHEGSSIESFAKILVGLGVKDNTVVGQNMPKKRVGKKPGRNAVYRYGSTNSTVSSKAPRKCGFCKSQGSGANNSHQNQSSCPVKASFGAHDKIAGANDAKAISAVASKLEDILRSTNMAYNDMSMLFGAEEMKKRLFIDSVPQGTKRIQVKGYHVCKEGRYLFCVCIDYLGEVLSRTEGSETKSYADVFIHDTAVLTSLGKFDYVFWEPSRSGPGNLM